MRKMKVSKELTKKSWIEHYTVRLGLTNKLAMMSLKTQP